MKAHVYHIHGKGWFWWAGGDCRHGPFSSSDEANADAIGAGATHIQSMWSTLIDARPQRVKW